MQTLATSAEIREAIKVARLSGKRIGFVPTMGALHEGHLSLMRQAREYSDIVVASIFVNPTQFNSSRDLERYPRVIEQDSGLASSCGVDILFVPNVTEIYPGGIKGAGEGVTSARVVAGDRSLGLCGATRPGHFDGVVTVVSILFNILQPDVAVFGEKDYQQMKVIEQMVQDLGFGVEIISGKTVRDADGLALSSRNLLLTAEERFQALYIPRTLEKALEMFRRGERNVQLLRETALENLQKSRGLKVDYLEICDTHSLKSLSGEISDQAQMLVAAFSGDVRLIDNIRLSS